MHERTTRRTVAAALAAMAGMASSLHALTSAPATAKVRTGKKRRQAHPVVAQFLFADVDLQPHGNGHHGHHEMRGSGDAHKVVVTRKGQERTMSLAGYERAFKGYATGDPLVTIGDRHFRLHGHTHHRPSGTVTFHLVEEESQVASVRGYDENGVLTCCCVEVGHGIKDGEGGRRCCPPYMIGGDWTCSDPGQPCRQR